MNQPVNSQLTHPKNPHKRLNNATYLTPSTDVLRPEKRRRVYNEGEGLDSATTSTGTDGSHAQRPLDMSVGGREGPEPAIATTGAHVHAQAQVHASHDQSPLTPISAESIVTPDVMQRNTFFQNAQGVNISGNPNFQNNVTNVYGQGTDGLQNLNGYISFDAQFDSSAQDPDRQCHPGTRQNVLKRLGDWVDNPNSAERIFWLYGPAGAGKSAIAQTIAHSYCRPKVAGTFFFFRSDINRNDGNRLFTTLAYQLAFSMPEIREYIAHSLSKRPDLPRTKVETQFEQLFIRPFHVLSLDAIQQLAPAVYTINDIVKKYQELAPVIIIDGIDECTDENLQRRFLKIIGDTADDHFPLRFLIVSRPEVHIERTIRRFQTPILTIDLAKLNDANRDIEKYLVEEFSHIASEQGFDPTWPGPEIIRDIVYKSSGNFIYASVVIKFVGDPYCFAKTQLQIVMNIKPPKAMSPFAVLDQLFLEILGRVPDQDFLKRYLTLLTARISVSGDYGDLHEDDAVLMHVSREELHANLRRMRSLLRFEAAIDVHHRSFLDFLHKSSRSGQYHIRYQSGIRDYVKVVVDSLVRYISTVIEQPDHHNVPHFAPRFRARIEVFPQQNKLSLNEWPEVMQPLLDIQNKLLQLPNFPSTWHLLRCGECTFFRLLRELFYLGLHQAVFYRPSYSSVQSVIDVVRRRTGVVSSTTTKKKTNDNDLESLLLSLLAHFPDIVENRLPTEEVIKLVSAILRFDYIETAKRVCFVSDAQKLIDLLYYLIDEKVALGRIDPDAARKATLLALEIFNRVPIFPRSFSSIGNDELHYNPWTLASVDIEVLAQTIFASRILDRRYISPVVAVKDEITVISCTQDLNDVPIKDWRRSNPSSMAVIQIMLGLAKAIQYFHSMGVVLYQIGSDAVFLDSDFHPQIRCLCSTSRILLEKPWKERFSLEGNIFSFGRIFYELYSGVDESTFPIEIRRRSIKLIQRCCARDLKGRPSMDEVVQEMERWNIE